MYICNSISNTVHTTTLCKCNNRVGCQSSKKIKSKFLLAKFTNHSYAKIEITTALPCHNPKTLIQHTYIQILFCKANSGFRKSQLGIISYRWSLLNTISANTDFTPTCFWFKEKNSAISHNKINFWSHNAHKGRKLQF